jgi:hypothetical protein
MIAWIRNIRHERKKRDPDETVPGMLTPPLVPRGTRLKDVISQGSPL